MRQILEILIERLELQLNNWKFHEFADAGVRVFKEIWYQA
ncbi:hypothetical protein SAMN02982919_03180 [Giesbergeria anulus]|uniref:Uncharacterized protein n=1 Tax=Giesbergeria anulus TaxID=180197 RepID=A0A1H9SNJ2_9BURK|nr:hypothetical protein SAMN02982919_03180 [Giesbergeria anulus]